MNSQVLADRAVLEITGADKFTFLQGIITNDIELVKKQQLIYSLILTPQGRFLFDIFFYFIDDKLYLDCYLGRVEELKKYLKKYILRSDVQIHDTDFAVIVTNNENPRLYADPRFAKIGYRGLVKKSEANLVDKENFYYPLLYSYAIPTPHIDLTEERSFPLDYGMHLLNAISFTKGCFIGQELSARMKHRDLIRKKIVKVVSEFDLSKIVKSTEMQIGQNKVGEFLSSLGKSGIALLRIEDFEKHNDGNPIIIENIEIQIETAEWQVK
jgi:folate-binding protein YgfZ